MTAPPLDREAAIAEATGLGTPHLCPELTLHLARDVLSIWEATERAEGREQLPPPFWAFAWPGGQTLARHVLDHPELVRGKRVLDFASGGGVSAIAAARAGGQVTATEIDPWALTAIALNARLNRVELEIRGDDVVGTDAGWEVVLAGDVCYQQQASLRITAWLRQVVRRGALVLFGDPGRTFFPRAGLRELARHRVPTTVDLEGVEHRDTAVWAMDPG